MMLLNVLVVLSLFVGALGSAIAIRGKLKKPRMLRDQRAILKSAVTGLACLSFLLFPGFMTGVVVLMTQQMLIYLGVGLFMIVVGLKLRKSENPAMRMRGTMNVLSGIAIIGWVVYMYFFA